MRINNAAQNANVLLRRSSLGPLSRQHVTFKQYSMWALIFCFGNCLQQKVSTPDHSVPPFGFDMDENLFKESWLGCLSPSNLMMAKIPPLA